MTLTPLAHGWRTTTNARELWANIASDLKREATVADMRQFFVSMGYNRASVNALSDAAVRRLWESGDGFVVEDTLNPDDLWEQNGLRDKEATP